VAAVDFSRVTKRFGTTTAVDGLDLGVDDGEFLVLLGPSCCGKSTVLRLLAGLERPSEGTISIGGRRVDDVESKDRDLAMVFQSYALYPHMTVAKNIAFPLRPRGVAKAERDRLTREAAEMLDLGELLDRKPAQLSGGQRQRVALARAIVRRPAVFLMDEPLSNLDAKLRTQTRTELVELHRRLGTTFIYVTHDQVEAMTMADRIAIMNRGRLQQLGSPQAVYDRPANLFVARFVGSPPMNIIPGVLEPASRLVSAAGAAIPAPRSLCERFSARATVPVEVGVRPEHLRFTTTTQAGPRFAATVTLIEALGHEQLVHAVAAGGTPIVVRSPLTGGGSVPMSIAVGATVQIGVDPIDVHLFDASSTERLDA
jgi:multiple sugar transport system ATP-binding protein